MTNMSDLDKIISTLDDVKSPKITHLDVSGITSMTDHMLIATGNNVRHNRAMMQALLDLSPQLSMPKPQIEGEDYCQWILVNFGDVIVHIMLPDTREYYAIEKLWSKEL